MSVRSKISADGTKEPSGKLDMAESNRSVKGRARETRGFGAERGRQVPRRRGDTPRLGRLAHRKEKRQLAFLPPPWGAPGTKRPLTFATPTPLPEADVSSEMC